MPVTIVAEKEYVCILAMHKKHRTLILLNRLTKLTTNQRSYCKWTDVNGTLSFLKPMFLVLTASHRVLELDTFWIPIFFMAVMSASLSFQNHRICLTMVSKPLAGS